MRYGAYAMEIMINELLKMGARRSNLEAKVFGGGNVLRGFTVNKVGQTNAAFVIEYLRKENIRIAAQDMLDDLSAQGLLLPAQLPGAGEAVARGAQRHYYRARTGV